MFRPPLAPARTFSGSLRPRSRLWACCGRTSAPSSFWSHATGRRGRLSTRPCEVARRGGGAPLPGGESAGHPPLRFVGALRGRTRVRPRCLAVGEYCSGGLLRLSGRVLRGGGPGRRREFVTTGSSCFANLRKFTRRQSGAPVDASSLSPPHRRALPSARAPFARRVARRLHGSGPCGSFPSRRD